MVDKTGLGIEDVIGSARDALLQLAAEHGAYHVRVFGSVARGEARPDSDLDLLVSWDYSRISSWGGVGFDLAAEKLLQRKVDVVSDRGLYPLIRERILSEAVPL